MCGAAAIARSFTGAESMRGVVLRSYQLTGTFRNLRASTTTMIILGVYLSLLAKYLAVSFLATSRRSATPLENTSSNLRSPRRIIGFRRGSGSLRAILRIASLMCISYAPSVRSEAAAPLTLITDSMRSAAIILALSRRQRVRYYKAFSAR